MDPIRDLDFWLNLGSFFAAAAVALFAIKFAYFDKKLAYKADELKNLKTTNNLINVVEKDIYEAELAILDGKYDSFGIDQSDVNQLNDAELKIIVQFIEDDPDYHGIIFDQVFSMLISKYEEERDSEYFLNPIGSWEMMISKLNILNNIKNCGRNYVEYESQKRVCITSIQYGVVAENNKKFNDYVSDKLLLSLFIAGIAIQLISLIAQSAIITTIVAFSPAIAIVISGLLILLDEIKSFYERMILDEDVHKKYNT